MDEFSSTVDEVVDNVDSVESLVSDLFKAFESLAGDNAQQMLASVAVGALTLSALTAF